MYSTILFIFLCLVLLISTYFFSYLSIASTKWTQRSSEDTHTRLSLITSFSKGILISTTLCIILPEGLSTVFSQSEGYSESTVTLCGVSMFAGFYFIYFVENASEILGYRAESHDNADFNSEIAHKLRQELLSYRYRVVPDIRTYSIFKKLINNEITLLGFMCHGICDGIAFGCSAVSDNSSLKITMVFSLLVHRFPVVFAITSTLLAKYKSSFGAEESYDANVDVNIEQIVLTEMLIFAASSSFMAIASYFLVLVFASHSSYNSVTGMLLLASGGSFLYVTMHVLAHKGSRGVELKRVEFLLTSLGFFVPLIVSMS